MKINKLVLNKYILIPSMALFVMQANALDMNDLKGAVKSVGTSTSSTTNTSNTSTRSSGVSSLSNSEARRP
jgi:hypothetical protein